MEIDDFDVTAITRQTYDQIAAGYVQSINRLVSDSWVGRFEKSLLDKFADLIERTDEPELTILDLGCGNGKDAYYLSRKKHMTATGLDYSSGMLTEARVAFPSVNFVNMDMRSLSFSNSFFNGVWANGCIYHVPKTDFVKVLSEVKRTLKPGGLFSFNFKLGDGEWLDQNPKSYGGKPRFYAYYQTKEMKSLLAQAGFNVLESQHYPEDVFGEKILHLWASKPG